MVNYDEVIMQADEHRTFLLENVEQQRLIQSFANSQPHPVKAWLGRQLVVWGQRLQGEQPLAQPTAPAMTTSS